MQSNKSLKSGILALLLAAITVLVGCGGGGTVPPINHPPTIVSLTAIPQSPIEINQSTVITCYATDQDNDELTYTWTMSGGTIVGSGSSITWTAPNIAGTYTITCTVSDGELSDTDSFNITVSEPPNQAPAITPISNATIILGETFTYPVEATDPDGDDLIFSLLTGSPPDMVIDENSGVITWTPSTTGSFDVTVEVSDGSESATQSFTITVNKALLVLIEVLPSSITLEIGESRTIDSVTAHYSDDTETIITPLSACTYESDKSNATVSPDGVITGVSLCTASTLITITVTYTEDSITQTDTVSVIVTNPSPT